MQLLVGVEWGGREGGERVSAPFCVCDLLGGLMLLSPCSPSFSIKSGFLTPCLLCLIVFQFFLFSRWKKFKTSGRNLYTAAKDCNIQKVLSLLGEFYFPSKPREIPARSRQAPNTKSKILSISCSLSLKRD